MPNQNFNVKNWYEQMVAEKGRLEMELVRVTKLTEILSSFVAEEESNIDNAGEDGDFEQLATLNKKIRILYMLLDVVRSLPAHVDNDSGYALILEKVAQLLDVDRSALFLIDPATNDLCAKVQDRQGIRETRFQQRIGLAGFVATSGRTMTVHDTSTDANFHPEIDEKPVYQVRNMMVTPLRDNAGTIFGVLQVHNKNTGKFTSDDEYLLQAFAAQAAMAIKGNGQGSPIPVSNAMMFIMKALSNGLDSNSLLQSLMKKTTQVMQADRSTVFLVDFANRELWSKVAEGTGINEIRFTMARGIAGHVATTGETVNIQEAYEDARFNKEIDIKTGYRTRTILCAPIRDETNTIIGVLQVLNKKEGIFTDKDVELIHAFARQVGRVLKSAQFITNLISVLEADRAAAV